MTITVKEKADLIVPPNVRRQAGLKSGTRVEFKVSGGIITIRPKLPTSASEYTPEQRRKIKAQIDEGLEDIRKGRVSRSFDTVDEMLASMKSGRKASGRQKTRSR